MGVLNMGPSNPTERPLLDAAEMPGGDDFTDVMDVLREAAAEMKPGEMIFMDNFTLEDAMSVFEIGEPRLDSGFVPEGEVNRSFVPLQPLLPDEICWILDRSFSCEMEWHAGNTLAQTVFTFLYVHHLGQTDPELLISRMPNTKEDFIRPQEQITVVLRAAVFGLLKCCDLTWRELSKGAVFDGEDWQGDKCEVSLLEGYPVKLVLQKLDEAILWVTNCHRITPAWCQAIMARLILRKHILQLMDLNMYKEPHVFLSLISACREQLFKIRRLPAGVPPPDSPAHLVFDPKVSRRLNTFMPIRVHELPSIETTWVCLEAMLDGWSEIHRLSAATDVTTWEIDGNLQCWSPQIPLKTPYIRSYTQTVFYDGVLVLNRFTPVWLVNRFFNETIGLPYDAFVTNVKQRWTWPLPPSFSNVEVLLPRLLTTHVRSHWYNPPRKRRHLMKSLPHWHALYDQLHSLTSHLHGNVAHPLYAAAPQQPSSLSAIDKLVDSSCCAVLMWRMSVIREVLLLGFQLELYSRDEKGFTYWYLSHVIATHLACLDRLMCGPVVDKVVLDELKFQHSFLSGLQLMSLALYSVSIKLMTSSIQQMRANFHLRYKWAFKPEYIDVPSPVIAAPKFDEFLPDCRDIARDAEFSPLQSIRHAEDIFSHLLQNNPVGGWAAHSAHNRVKFVRGLIDACTRLYKLPADMQEAASFDASSLKWDTSIHPWFPIVVDSRE